jgi:hypothetical protein
MRIAVVSESSADEAGVKVLVDAILGSESEMVALRTRPNGWPQVLSLLPNIITGLHYGTNVEALVVVVDSDESPIHQNFHEQSAAENPECRLCRLRTAVASALAKVRPLPNRPNMKTALGLAVPAIEAWYRCGVNPHVNEVAWNRKLHGQDVSYDKRSLKKEAYGSYQSNTNTAVEAARQLGNNLELLERLFPDGFGSLLRDIRGWSR